MSTHLRCLLEAGARLLRPFLRLAWTTFLPAAVLRRMRNPLVLARARLVPSNVHPFPFLRLHSTVKAPPCRTRPTRGTGRANDTSARAPFHVVPSTTSASFFHRVRRSATGTSRFRGVFRRSRTSDRTACGQSSSQGHGCVLCARGGAQHHAAARRRAHRELRHRHRRPRRSHPRGTRHTPFLPSPLLPRNPIHSPADTPYSADAPLAAAVPHPLVVNRCEAKSRWHVGCESL